MSTYMESLQHLADRYFSESGKARATTKELALWALQQGEWEPPSDLILRKCREDFARALREEYIKDEHGRPVRAKHARRVQEDGIQQTFWADIRNAPREFMEGAFQQRREQIVGDCCQLKRDVDYYNEHNPKQQPIQTLFDFRDDVEESAYSGELPSSELAEDELVEIES